jgi:hypothetical protein
MRDNEQGTRHRPGPADTEWRPACCEAIEGETVEQQEEHPMNETQAIRRLHKLLGADFGYRVDADAPVGEQRAVLAERSARTGATKLAAREAVERRRKELLLDAEYQRLLAASQQASQDHDIAMSEMCRRRITVGRVSKLFFSVEAEADNWAEAVAMVEAKHNKE